MTWLKDVVLRLFPRRDRGELVSLGLRGLKPREGSPGPHSISDRAAEPRLRVSHPANVPGDFYVEDNCCTMCGVPFVEAPELFGTYTDRAGYQQCFVKRQPATSEELDHMLGAIAGADLQCIRYGGRDRHIVQRLLQIGERDVCDHPQENL